MVAAVLSAAVVVAEATISPQLPNLSVFSLALHSASGGEFAHSLLTFVMLAYPCAVSHNTSSLPLLIFDRALGRTHLVCSLKRPASQLSKARGPSVQNRQPPA